MRILATYLQTVARLYFLLTIPAAACCLQLPQSYWQIHKHFTAICFPFSPQISPLFLSLLFWLAANSAALLVDCWFLGLATVSVSVARFEVVGLANAKHFLRLHLSMRNFLVCSPQIMQLICAQFVAPLYTHIWQALLTFERVYCIFNWIPASPWGQNLLTTMWEIMGNICFTTLASAILLFIYRKCHQISHIRVWIALANYKTISIFG